jgi:hypothetical protein
MSDPHSTGTPGAGNLDVDPGFARTWGRGPIVTHLLDVHSPCIDAGHPLRTDPPWQRLSERYAMFNGVSADMGAFGGPGAVYWFGHP